MIVKTTVCQRKVITIYLYQNSRGIIPRNTPRELWKKQRHTVNILWDLSVSDTLHRGKYQNDTVAYRERIFKFNNTYIVRM